MKYKSININLMRVTKTIKTRLNLQFLFYLAEMIVL